MNMSRHRAEEYWTPPTIWKGETAFCIAGGPSLRGADLSALKGQHAIAVNSSCHIAPWAEVLFFTDNSWFEKHEQIVADWPGTVVTCSRAAKVKWPDRVERVLGETRPDFPPPGSSIIRQGRSSGHTAVALAVAMAARRIVLLGYDMRIVDGRSHHHDDYACRDARVYENEFLPGFDGWAETAAKHGAEIVNATPGSAVTQFPMRDLGSILTEMS